MFGYFVLARENILLSSLFPALKICRIYHHYHTSPKLYISFPPPCWLNCNGLQIGRRGMSLELPRVTVLCLLKVYGGEGSPLSRQRLSSCQNTTQLNSKNYLISFFYFTAFSHLLHVSSGPEWFSFECRQLSVMILFSLHNGNSDWFSKTLRYLPVRIKTTTNADFCKQIFSRFASVT